jgi:proton-dependent oligopeptide transporter, POT family
MTSLSFVSVLIVSFQLLLVQCINIGALIGGIVIPVMAQTNVTMAFVPVVMLAVGVALFASGTPRYIRSQPAVHWKEMVGLRPAKAKKAAPYPSSSGDRIPLLVILQVLLLIVPFCIAYSQMATTFIVQGTVMNKAFGWIDVASMNNANAVAVLLFGSLVGNVIYPWCAAHNIKIPTMHKFAIGSALGAAAIAWALLVEYMIHREYAETGGKISIMWQAMAYILIGAGENLCRFGSLQGGLYGIASRKEGPVQCHESILHRKCPQCHLYWPVPGMYAVVHECTRSNSDLAH